MAQLTANHDKLYFDALCRTKKGESVLSLIHATYQAKLNCKDGDVKADIAKRLENAYNLFKKDAGTYEGGLKQFSSQYTIGHELCIWKNSNLDLTPLAIKVAENRITIRDYFDIVFLNYFQPVNNKVVHILFHLLDYMDKNGLDRIDKEEMGKAYMQVAGISDPGDINGAYNMLIASSYFKPDDTGKILIYSGICSIKELISKCDKTYVEKGYEAAKSELASEAAYIKYMLDDHRVQGKTKEDTGVYTEQQLAEELLELKKAYGTAGFHLFGIRRGKYIQEHSISTKKLCEIAGVQDSMFVEINKGRRLANYVSEKETYDNNIEIEDASDSDSQDEVLNLNYKDFIEGGYNAIYYGTPGCGKSYYVDNILLKDIKNIYKFRTTFYLDYTHTDFVGQLMPSVKKEMDDNGVEKEIVSYTFIPGPFTLALEKAYRNPKQMVYLVIEEINRGNAASILGDIFQLLDREKPGNKKNMPVGQSEYPIDKVDVVSFLENEKKIILPEGKLFIPSNLCLIGTMNTNDQNVSALDTAFKRRWKMKKIKNDFAADHPYPNKFVPGTAVSWKVFVEKINDRIVSDDSIGVNAEDKQIGPFFMDSLDLEFEPSIKNEEKQRDFAYKMLEYLWANVAKYERGHWFKGNPKTLDNLVDDYVEDGLDIFEGDLFNNDSEEDVQMHSDNGEEE